MSFFRRVASGDRETLAADVTGLLASTLFGDDAKSKTGIAVTLNRALQVSTVIGGCRVLAEGIAQVPFRALRKTGGRKEIAEDHPVHELLARRPNEFQTPFEFRETAMFHAVLAKGFFALKNRDATGVVRELLPLVPHNVTPKQDAAWGVTYQVTDRNGHVGTFPARDMFVVRGPSWDGFGAMQVLDLAREVLGLHIATEESQARLHANGVRPGGIISVEGGLSPEAKRRIVDAFIDSSTGIAKTGKVAVLDQAAKFQTMAMTGVDAQTLEARRFQVEEACRVIRVFPQMLGYSDKTSTYASAESFFIAHVVHSLGPWFKRWEDTAGRDLFTREEVAAGMCARFFPAALMRGDAAARSTFYKEAILTGWMTRNEARELEDLNPIDGLEAPLVPLNMSGVREDPLDDQVEEPADPENDPEDEPDTAK